MTIIAALLGAIVLLWLCSTNWRRAVKVALYVVVLEGALRKWVFPQISELVYFLKDGILLGAYAGYLAKERAPFLALTTRATLLILTMAISVILFLETLNPALNSVLVGLLGTKGYLLYVPLAFLLPDLFHSVGELERFVRGYLLFCLPVCLLGIAQFFAPPDSPINIYAKSLVETDVVTFEDGNVRITGTFPYLGGFTSYLTMCLAWMLAALVKQRLWQWRLLLSSVLILISVNLLMTGSRGAVLSAVILLISFVLYSLFERNRSGWQFALALMAMAGVCVLVSIGLFPTAVEAFMSRATGEADSVADRVGVGFIEPLLGAQYSGFGGYGAGSTQVACYALRQQLHLGPPAISPPPAEGEMLRVMLELGVFGFIVWYALRIYFLWLLWRVSRTVRHTTLRYLALAAFLFHALTFNGQLVTNTAVGVFYWFLAGFAFLLPRLDRVSSLPHHPQRRSLPLPRSPVKAGRGVVLAPSMAHIAPTVDGPIPPTASFGEDSHSRFEPESP